MKNKRHSICDGYGDLLKECDNIEVEKGQTEIYSESVVVEERQKGILYESERNGEWKWFKDGDEEKDGKYVGEIENGIPNGQGTQTWKNPYEFYEGEWKDGIQNGQGTRTWSNGDKYVGEEKDGKRNGQGTYTYKDGRKFIGEWKNGEKWNGTQYDKDGNITKKYVKGVEQ